jgi:hypothetical protein
MGPVLAGDAPPTTEDEATLPGLWRPQACPFRLPANDGTGADRGSICAGTGVTRDAQGDVRTDPARWRLRVEHGRNTWHYLTDDAALHAWPQTIIDRHHLNTVQARRSRDCPAAGTYGTPQTDNLNAACGAGACVCLCLCTYTSLHVYLCMCMHVFGVRTADRCADVAGAGQCARGCAQDV